MYRSWFLDITPAEQVAHDGWPGNRFRPRGCPAAKPEPNRNANSTQRRRDRRAHARTAAWWKGMGNPRGNMPPRMGHGSLEDCSTVWVTAENRATDGARGGRGWETREETCPHEWGHGSLEDCSTVWVTGENTKTGTAKAEASQLSWDTRRKQRTRRKYSANSGKNSTREVLTVAAPIAVAMRQSSRDRQKL